MQWSQIPLWDFSWITLNTGSRRCTVKVAPSVEDPYVSDVVLDGNLKVRYLANGAHKVVGYSLKFKPYMRADMFGYSMAVTYTDKDPANCLVLVCATPHMRVLRAGETDSAVYHVVLRKNQRKAEAEE